MPMLMLMPVRYHAFQQCAYGYAYAYVGTVFASGGIYAYLVPWM